jgi:hypothetical protein
LGHWDYPYLSLSPDMGTNYIDWAQLNSLLPVIGSTLHIPNAVLNENRAMDNVTNSNNFTVSNNTNESVYGGFGALTTVVINVTVFWDIATCSEYVNERIRGAYHLHLQGRKSAEPEISVQSPATFCVLVFGYHVP